MFYNQAHEFYVYQMSFHDINETMKKDFESFIIRGAVKLPKPFTVIFKVNSNPISF